MINKTVDLYHKALTDKQYLNNKNEYFKLDKKINKNEIISHGFYLNNINDLKYAPLDSKEQNE